MKHKILILAFLFSTLFSFAAEFYVAPNGNDSNNGHKDQPVESIKKAQELAQSGDTVYIRGGVYSMRENQIAAYNRAYAYVTQLDKNHISYLPSGHNYFFIFEIKNADKIF